MFKSKLAALLALLILPAGSAAAAEEAAKPLPGEEPTLAVVNGLRPDDLLNVRATASATGIVLGRLPNGSAVRNRGCGQFSGYKWCRVEALDVPGLAGWSPGRYLRAPSPDEAPEIEAKSAATPALSPAAETPAPAAAFPSGPPLTPPAPVAATAAAPAASALAVAAPSPGEDATTLPEANTTQVAAGPGRSERLNAAGSAVSRKPLGATSGETAPVGEILAARMGETGPTAGAPVPAKDNLVTGEIYSLAAKTGENWVDEETPADTMPPPLPPVTEAAPTPAPRPQPVSADLADSPQIVAQLQPSAPAVDAAGEIPCARYVGQPMTRCAAEVVRSGADAADVTVSWPDGGKRVIRFRGGKPEGANSRGEFRFSREGDLSMIRIGLSERFEIPDSLPFGD